METKELMVGIMKEILACQNASDGRSIDAALICQAKNLGIEDTRDVLTTMKNRGWIECDFFFGGKSMARVTTSGKLYLENEDNPEPVAPLICKQFTSFTISNPTSSIIGTQGTATINIGPDLAALSDLINKHTMPEEDRAMFKQLINELHAFMEGKTQMRVGIWDKFSALMERHSWITNPISSVILNLLLGLFTKS